MGSDEPGGVAGVVVRDLILPAAYEDAYPAEGEGTDGGVVAFAGGSLAVVEGGRPSTMGDRAAGELVQGLTDGLWTGPAHVDPAGGSAGDRQGSNAAEVG